MDCNGLLTLALGATTSFGYVAPTKGRGLIQRWRNRRSYTMIPKPSEIVQIWCSAMASGASNGEQTDMNLALVAIRRDCIDKMDFFHVEGTKRRPGYDDTPTASKIRCHHALHPDIVWPLSNLPPSIAGGSKDLHLLNPGNSRDKSNSLASSNLVEACSAPPRPKVADFSIY